MVAPMQQVITILLPFQVAKIVSEILLKTCPQFYSL